MTNIADHILSNIRPAKIIDAPTSAYVPIDISKQNKELETFNIASSKEWEMYITNYLKKRNAKVAYGGYFEVRDIYKRSPHFASRDKTHERNIHLGIDLWSRAGTPVLAPLEGTIHSFKNNTNYGDYGPTIILQHTVKTVPFYTLYGHLSLDSIHHIKTRQTIKKGEVIGYLGAASVNGSYAPHVHFQIVLDLENHLGDYSGVASKEAFDFYRKNCPDPSLIVALYQEEY
ncbi:MAG: peptidoglycan DD-metalloendopeptidase family protein [Flavobacteriaceae bacterium]|nr:MAG: peptidoglycan DD-metalloendopeptidase family protein [Flavobacteriaceae bacterium]